MSSNSGYSVKVELYTSYWPQFIMGAFCFKLSCELRSGRLRELKDDNILLQGSSPMVALTGLIEAFELIKWKKVERLTVTSDSSPLVKFLTHGVSTGCYFLEQQVRQFVKDVPVEAEVKETPEWVVEFLGKLKEPYEELRTKSY